jgi:regulator of sigma E protease
MGIIETLLIFFGVLGLLVCAHEFGHFIAAKRAGIRVDEFGFGFPPRIIGKTFRGTLYSLNWIPLGGFVKIKGVAGDDAKAADNLHASDSFGSKPFHTKFTILFAGILMNLCLAVGLFSVVYLIGIQTVPEQVTAGAVVLDQQVVVAGVIPGSPAEAGGILAGDTIEAVNGQPIQTGNDLRAATGDVPGEAVTVSVRHDDASREISLETATLEFEGQQYTGIGIGLQELATVRYPWYLAAWKGLTTTIWTVAQIGLALWDIAVNALARGQVGDDFAGPVGIAVLTGQVAELGIANLLQFTALLSVNLAVFNLLPIPALDGGRLAFVVLEKIRRRPVSLRSEAIVHNIGFALLLLLVLLVTLKDLSRYNVFGFFQGLFV